MHEGSPGISANDERERPRRVSLVLHRAVAERLREDPAVLGRARARVRSWRETGQVHPFYVDRWEEALRGTPEEVAARIVDPGEQACALRQVSPFAGVLLPRERWALWRSAWTGRSSST